MAGKIKNKQKLQDVTALAALAKQAEAGDADPRMKEMLQQALQEAYEQFQHEHTQEKRLKEQALRDEQDRLEAKAATEAVCSHTKPNGHSNLRGQDVIVKDGETKKITNRRVLFCGTCFKFFEQGQVPGNLMPESNIGGQLAL